MTNQIKVSEIMTKSVIVAGLGSTFDEVVTFFTEVNIHHLPVSDGGALVGILSLTDLTNFLLAQAKAGNASVASAFKVSEVMTPNPVTISDDETVGRVVDILAQGEFQSVPVTSGGSLVGIVTNKDIVKMLQWEYTHKYGSGFATL